MLLNDPESGSDLASRQTMTLRHFDLRLKPHLRLAFLVLNMDVHPRLFPREEEQPKSSLPQNGGTHDLKLSVARRPTAAAPCQAATSMVA